MRRGSIPFLIIILFTSLLVSCGGGGSDGPNFVTDIAFTFPIEDADVYDASLTVSGVTAAPVDVVLVNGQPALSDDGFLTWRADLLLGSGANSILVEARKSGSVVASATRELAFVGQNITQMDLLSSRVGDVICILDRVQGKLFKFDVVTHERVGVNVDIPSLVGIPERNILYVDYDPVGDRAFVLDRSLSPELLEVDFSTGTMQVLTLPAQILGQLRCFVLDRATNELLVFAYYSVNSMGAVFTRLYSWDLATGEVAVVSDETQGMLYGEKIHNAVLDHLGGQIYCFDNWGHDILRIDLASGQRFPVALGTSSYIDRMALIDNGQALAFILRSGSSPLGQPSRLDLNLGTYSAIPVPTGQYFNALAEQDGGLPIITDKQSLLTLSASGLQSSLFGLTVGTGPTINLTGLALDPVRGKILTSYFTRMNEVDLRTGERRRLVAGQEEPYLSLSIPAVDVATGRILVAGKEYTNSGPNSAGLYVVDPEDGSPQFLYSLLYGPVHRLVADPAKDRVLIAYTDFVLGFEHLRFRFLTGISMGPLKSVNTIDTRLDHGIDIDSAGDRLFVIGYDAANAPLKLFQVDVGSLTPTEFGPPALAPIDYSDIRAIRLTQNGSRLCLLKKTSIEVLDAQSGTLIDTLQIRGLGDGINLTDVVEDPVTGLLYASIVYGALANGVIVIEPSSGSWHYLSR